MRGRQRAWHGATWQLFFSDATSAQDLILSHHTFFNTSIMSLHVRFMVRVPLAFSSFWVCRQTWLAERLLRSTGWTRRLHLRRRERCGLQQGPQRGREQLRPLRLLSLRRVRLGPFEQGPRLGSVALPHYLLKSNRRGRSPSVQRLRSHRHVLP